VGRIPWDELGHAPGLMALRPGADRLAIEGEVPRRAQVIGRSHLPGEMDGLGCKI
jgi:hypothetical protein